jgi:DNA-binding helix-hairpin-helix protein with protein kinase domain
MNVIGLQSQRLYVTSRQLAAGGEGATYTVNGDPSLLLKIFDTPPPHSVVRKLALLAQWNPRPAGCALPIESVVEPGSNRVVGFVQPRFDKAVPLAAVLDDHGRRTHGFADDLATRVRILRLLAEAFVRVHEASLVIGDVSPGNFLLARDWLGRPSFVFAIDCNSFQVFLRTPHGNEFHPSGVATEEYAAPEVQPTDWSTSLRSVFSDSFGFGVIAWKMIFNGSHPNTVASHRNVDVPPIGERIERRICPYAPVTPLPPGWSAPPLTPSLDVLPTAVRDLFFTAFTASDPRDRPELVAWQRAIRNWERVLLPSLLLRLVASWHGGIALQCSKLLANASPWAGRLTILAGIVFLAVIGPGTAEPPRSDTGRQESGSIRRAWFSTPTRPRVPRPIDRTLFPELVLERPNPE